MLKRALRAGVRLARQWLEEKEAVPEYNYCPPFSYEDANLFFKNFIKQNENLRRPHFTWGAVQGLNLARALGLSRISFIEFGVAGGNGLVAFENIALKLQPIFNIEVDIHGFDAVDGMPQAMDHRDLPN